MTSYKITEHFIGYSKLYFKSAGKTILLNNDWCMSTCLIFSSPQSNFNTDFFFDAFFQDLPNLMTRERQAYKVKVCGEPDFFPCVQRPRGL